MSKRVLVTGASGFAGANLVRRLLADGHETHLLLRPPHQTWRLRDIGGHAGQHHAHIENGAAVRAIVHAVRPDWVFHLAGYGAYSFTEYARATDAFDPAVGAGACSWTIGGAGLAPARASQQGMEEMVSTNVMGTVYLLDACADEGVEAFIHTGSSSEYGLQQHATSEAEALDPNSHYAITKATATHYCRHTAISRDVNAIVLRMYSLYGPWEEPARLLPALVVNGLKGRLPGLVAPDSAHDFVWVEDAVDAMVLAAATPGVARGSILNVSSGRQTTLADIVSITRRVLDIEAEPQWGSMSAREGDTATWCGDPAKASAALGWTATTDLEHGIRKMADWLIAHPEMLRMYESRLGLSS